MLLASPLNKPVPVEVPEVMLLNRLEAATGPGLENRFVLFASGFENSEKLGVCC